MAVQRSLLNYLFTKEEVAESDLTARFLAANSERIKAIEAAARSLLPFGIRSEALETLVRDAIKAHAETLPQC